MDATPIFIAACSLLALVSLAVQAWALIRVADVVSKAIETASRPEVMTAHNCQQSGFLVPRISLGMLGLRGSASPGPAQFQFVIPHLAFSSVSTVGDRATFSPCLPVLFR